MKKVLVKQASATWCARVSCDSMIEEGIDDGDMLVVDKSIKPSDGKIVVSFIDGEFTLKRLAIKADGIWLCPAKSDYNPIKIEDENNFQIW